MKLTFIIVLLIIFIDQFIKIYIKTHFEYYEIFKLFDGFYLNFIENPGMAYGIQLGGLYGKIILNILRCILIIMIILYYLQSYKNDHSIHFIISFSLIIAGAIGNLIDGLFYGIIFDKGLVFDSINQIWVPYKGLAKLNFKGYSGLFKGVVVDMFQISIFNGYLPIWIPFFGGKNIQFFKYIFNIADFSIVTGILWIFIFKYKKNKN